MERINKNKTTPEITMLVLNSALLVLFLIYRNNWFLYGALGLGLAGIFSPWLSRKIDFLWTKLAQLLSYIVPNILMGVVFYGVLFPISLMSKVFSKSTPLQLKYKRGSMFKETNKTFEKSTFEKMW